MTSSQLFLWKLVLTCLLLYLVDTIDVCPKYHPLCGWLAPKLRCQVYEGRDSLHYTLGLKKTVHGTRQLPNKFLLDRWILAVFPQFFKLLFPSRLSWLLHGAGSVVRDTFYLVWWAVCLPCLFPINTPLLPPPKWNSIKIMLCLGVGKALVKRLGTCPGQVEKLLLKLLNI